MIPFLMLALCVSLLLKITAKHVVSNDHAWMTEI